MIVKNKDGHILEFLHSYSPDLNLIEHYWFKIKNDICKVSHLFNNLSKLIYYMI
ncbi:transposase [Orientia tsutsugamushi]|uniref:transposase n=1 Tax=Orientia tsutsugamushi TaxID=784 RepID=UPI00061F6C23|nr:DDE superendonuclease family protein [Orientia tsutsugamushi str. Karp]